jgi:hypothetical protein
VAADAEHGSYFRLGWQALSRVKYTADELALQPFLDMAV